MDTVKELRQRNPANLAAQLTKINEQRKLTKGAVSEAQIAGWIQQAKGLDPKVSY